MGMMENIIIILYLATLGYLGFVGYKQTKSSADYLIAGGNTHPFVMALSYGATFISTAAIVGLQPYQIREQTGHKSDATLARYIRPVEKRRIPSLL